MLTGSLWNFETIRGSLMTHKWQKLASLAQEICTLWFQFFGAVFASEGYPFKNILYILINSHIGTLGNIDDPDKMYQNTSFYQGLHCLLT